MADDILGEVKDHITTATFLEKRPPRFTGK
jgi:hypothetical protein